jgi:hypothetical protein
MGRLSKTFKKKIIVFCRQEGLVSYDKLLFYLG